MVPRVNRSKLQKSISRALAAALLISIFIGLGILLYGLAYFLIHDVLIHQRFKWFKNTNSWYLKALRKGHKVHHKNMGKEESQCFGMLFVPFKYFKKPKLN